MILLKNCPQLLKGKTAERGVGVSFFSLQLFLLQIFVYTISDTHVLLD